MECDAEVCWRNREVSFVLPRGKVLRCPEMRDVAAKTSFSVDHSVSVFENGWVGLRGDAFKAVSGRRVDCSVGDSEASLGDIIKTRSRSTESFNRTTTAMHELPQRTSSIPLVTEARSTPILLSAVNCSHEWNSFPNRTGTVDAPAFVHGRPVRMEGYLRLRLPHVLTYELIFDVIGLLGSVEGGHASPLWTGESDC
jgi:hypothetical protein